jgi:hypothetical protein
MNEIPNLVLDHLFSFFSYYQRFKFVLVCKKWNMIINNSVENDPDKKIKLTTTFCFEKKVSEVIGLRKAFFEDNIFKMMEIKTLDGIFYIFHCDPPSYEVNFYHYDCHIFYLFSNQKILEKIKIEQEQPGELNIDNPIIRLKVSIEVDKYWYSRRIKCKKKYSDGTKINYTFPIVNDKLKKMLKKLDYQEWYNVDLPDIGICIEKMDCLRLPSF